MWRTASSHHTHWEAMISAFSSSSSFMPTHFRPLRTLVLPSHSRASFSSSHFQPPLHRFSSFTSSFRHPSRNSVITTVIRSLSSISSGEELECKEPCLYSEAGSSSDGYQEHLLELQKEKQSRFITVKAYFLCTSIDLRSLQNQNAFNVIPPNSRATNYIVLRYCDIKADPHGAEATFGSGSNCCHMVVFQYGSIVLFNVSDHEVDGYLKIVEKHASGLLPEMRKDDYAVVEKPSLKAWMQGGLDYIMLRNLTIDGIRTIGSVLGQSIALDYYIRQVDGMVAEFTDINRGMEKTGTFTMKRKKLFQLVGKANSNLADVILKLGLFERSDIAWKDANYAQIWEYLRDEYELTQRFGSLDFKLKFVEHNIRFLQEILQNRKSDFLEWLIIILISVEILISVYNIVRESTMT
ncbi:protein RETARDED ROOT GROWTH, mitochondrial-like [Magnolia sinica]|uniref:protein RETARDED ROOT GROWTH, mitochondrial-like n=1 Tax=Magnolia sinica TaxID=86752 RepID=UPI00265A3D47|nr:protein RETARDED ROOT GROWTH, mitochondrial-like [Magnolia sinica]